jgi:uncharacterized membrane protein YuzA (DUF378 family)
VFLFKDFCDVVAKVVIIIQKINLTQFGYIQYMKVEKPQNLSIYSWLSTGTYHENLVILVFGKFGKIWAILP